MAGKKLFRAQAPVQRLVKKQRALDPGSVVRESETRKPAIRKLTGKR